MKMPVRFGERRRLPDRRRSFRQRFSCLKLVYNAAFGLYDDGGLGEVFLDAGKAGTHAEISAKESAIAASLALQYGCPPEVLRKALLRDASGRADGPLGRALDLWEQEAGRAGRATGTKPGEGS